MTVLSIVTIVFLLQSCGFINYTEITVELPQPPASWPAELTGGVFVVRYLESGDLSGGTIGEIEIGSQVRSLRLRLPNLPVVPVVAVPVYGNPPAVLKPCGAIYPSQKKEGERLGLTWAEGFLAELLLTCASSGGSMQAVNTPKLQFELLGRSDGDPWRLDVHELLTAVVSETLSYRSLKLLPAHEVTLEAPPGRWISGNPLRRRPVEGAHGVVVFADLPEGVHSFFRAGGNGRIDISVEPDGWTAVYPVTGGGSTGNW